MRKFLLYGAIILMVISCSKENFDKKDGLSFMNSTELKSTLIKIPNLDSIVRMETGEFLKTDLTRRELDSILEISSRQSSKSISSYIYESPEYYDWSHKIHLKAFAGTTYPNYQNWPSLEVAVPSDYIVVGGGAKVWGYENGAFLTASYPNASLTSWTGKSKDHINPDPHFITVYAIGMKMDSVTPEYLRSKIHLYTQTSIPANHPVTVVTIPDNCLRLGGGAKVNWSDYGNLLYISKPWENGNSWMVKSKDHIKPSPCTITGYIIGIENISFPKVGYVQVDTTWQQAYVSFGEGWIASPVRPTYALTGVGAHAYYYINWGRMLVQMYPYIYQQEPPYQEAQILSKDHIHLASGYTQAYAVMIRAVNVK